MGGRKRQSRGGDGDAVLGKVVREGLSAEVTAEQNLGWTGGGSHVDVWNVLGKETDRSGSPGFEDQGGPTEFGLGRFPGGRNG